jgi:predicted nuclease of predicted toxin-antitoxin system
MRIKLDENLPASVVAVLVAFGHDVDTVHDEGLTGHPDVDVFNGAQQAKRFLITQDLDFSDTRRFAPGTHEGILLLRLPEPGRVALRDRIRSLFASEEVATWSGCFVVATDRKLRVQRPKQG